MAADKILIDGVASKGKLTEPPSDTVEQVCLFLRENLLKLFFNDSLSLD
jgi:hypothetical protein